MDLDRGEIGGTAGQRVGRRAVVVDDEITDPDVRALRRRASPRLFNHDVPGLELLRNGGRGARGRAPAPGAEEKSVSFVFPFRLLVFRRARQAYGFTVNSKVPCV